MTLQHKNRLISVAAAGLLVCFVAQAVLSMKGKSVTVDEITCITAGYYHLRTGGFHYNMKNPPLMKITRSSRRQLPDLRRASAQLPPGEARVDQGLHRAVAAQERSLEPVDELALHHGSPHP